MPNYYIASPQTRPVKWKYGGPLIYMYEKGGSTSTLLLYNGTGFDSGAESYDYNSVIFDGEIFEWWAVGLDGAALESPTTSYSATAMGGDIIYVNGPTSYNFLNNNDYTAQGFINDLYFGFAWQNWRGDDFNIRIYNKSDSSLAYSHTITVPSQPTNVASMTVYVGVDYFAFSMRHHGTSTDDPIVSRLYQIDGTFVSEVQNETGHDDDPWGPPENYSNGREHSLFLTSDRVYAGNRAYDLTGADKGPLPDPGYIYNEHSLYSPFACCMVSNGSKLVMCEGYWRYSRWGWSPSGLMDSIVNYYEYSITKGGTGVNDTYTLDVDTTYQASTTVDYWFGVMVDQKGLY